MAEAMPFPWGGGKPHLSDYKIVANVAHSQSRWGRWLEEGRRRAGNSGELGRRKELLQSLEADDAVMSYLSVLVSLILEAVCFWYLLPSSRPRPWWKRVFSFMGLTAIFLLPVLRSETGWSLSYSYRPGWEIILSSLAFLGLVVGFWVLGEDGVLDIIGRTITLLLLPMVFFLSRVSGVLLGTALKGALTGAYISGARIDATHSYELFDAQALIGGTHFERCVIYRNPVWFPAIRHEISNRPLYNLRSGDVSPAKAHQLECAQRGNRVR